MNPSTARRRTRAVRLVSLLAAAALLAAACGSDDAASPAATGAGGHGHGGSRDRPPRAATPATTAPRQRRRRPATPRRPRRRRARPPTSRSGGTLTLGLSTDPISIQPRGGGAGNDQLYVARQLFDSLLEQDPATGKLIPWLAESYEVSPDATTFTFHLRDDVTFSDGTPLTAQVVKDNFDDIVASGREGDVGDLLLRHLRQHARSSTTTR